MKKLLLTTLLTLIFACTSVDASMVMIDYIGETYVTPNNIERTLIVNSDDGRSYNIALRPLEEAITSVNGDYTIPLEYLFMNNTREDVYFKYNEYSNIFWGTEMNGVPRNMTAKIKDYGVVPAGTYSILFELQAVDVETGEIAAMSSFNLQFVVPIIHELHTYSDSPHIKVSAENAFKKLHKNVNETSPMVYIRSNTDWILSLDPKDFGETVGKYYVTTTSGSGKVTTRLQERALITPEREIILARGKAPAQNEFVAIEFSIEGNEGNLIPAGNYVNKIKYVLREGEE